VGFYNNPQAGIV